MFGGWIFFFQQWFVNPYVFVDSLVILSTLFQVQNLCSFVEYRKVIMKDECQRIYKEAHALMVLPRHFPGEEAKKKKHNCPIAMAQSKFTTAVAERHYCVVTQT